MEKKKLVLSLNKEVIAQLHSKESRAVFGGGNLLATNPTDCPDYKSLCNTSPCVYTCGDTCYCSQTTCC
jgi:hypothetical protein